MKDGNIKRAVFRWCEHNSIVLTGSVPPHGLGPPAEPGPLGWGAAVRLLCAVQVVHSVSITAAVTVVAAATRSICCHNCRAVKASLAIPDMKGPGRPLFVHH